MKEMLLPLIEGYIKAMKDSPTERCMEFFQGKADGMRTALWLMNEIDDREDQEIKDKIAFTLIVWNGTHR